MVVPQMGLYIELDRHYLDNHYRGYQLTIFNSVYVETVTKDINDDKSFADIFLPVILDNGIAEKRKFKLIYTINYSENGPT